MTASYLTSMIADMEQALGCEIKIVEDKDSRYPCKLEYARNYARSHHVLRVNSARCKNPYPVFSVLLFSKLQQQEMPDGSIGVLQPVSSIEEHARFNDDFKADSVGRKLIARLGREADSVVSSLQGGLITQACNQILEMLAADVVLRDYPDAIDDMKEFPPSVALENARVGREELLQTYPAFIVDANRFLNLMFSMKCGEISGRNLVDAYKPTSDELDKALDLYNFYRAERDALKSKDRIAGDVLRNILREVSVDRYVHLLAHEIAPNIPEKQENDPAENGLTEEQKESLRKFKENFGDGKPDEKLMALGMSMVLREVRAMPIETVRALAIEVAMLGTRGISPTGRYNLKGLPNRRDIPGVEILAWYYVTWMRVFPEHIDMIGLPYKKAYESAVAMLASQDGGKA